MEMTYDGALVMPSSYAVMQEDEMMYLEGSFSGSMLAKNLKGAYTRFKAAKRALLAGGLTLGAISKTAAMTAKSIYLCYGSAISATAYAVGGIVLGTIIAASLFAGITYLGNHKVWY